MMIRLARAVVFAAAICIALPSAAADESASADAPQPAPLTVAQAREAQALFGFDEAIPVIIEMTFKLQPEYASITAEQRECTIREVSPGMHAMFDNAFIALFGDTGILDGWKAFAQTAGGKRFIDNMRTAAMRQARDEPSDDVSSAAATMSDAEKDDIRAFSSSRAASVLHKSFPDLDMTPEDKAALLARIRQTCGVTLGNL